MPFESEKQERWMRANKPAMARRWTKEHGSLIGKYPKKKKRGK